MSKRKIGPEAQVKSFAIIKIDPNLGAVSVKMAKDAPKALADRMQISAATLRDEMNGRSVSRITTACNRNCQTFCGMLSYHAHPQKLPKVDFNYGAPYWELKPGFKAMVRELGDIRKERARIGRAWNKLPEGKKDKQATDLHERKTNQAFARDRAWHIRFAPLRVVFIPPVDDRPPFFNFPWSFRNKDDARLVGEFLYELSESRYFTSDGGAPPGSRTVKTNQQREQYDVLKDRGCSDAVIAQKLWPKEFEDQKGDPFPKTKMRLSRYRAIKSRRR